MTKRPPPGVRQAPSPRLLVLPVFLALLTCQCHLLGAQRTISQVRDEVFRLEAVTMPEAARYHLDTARGLLAAAEKQYEDADFGAALKFAQRAHEQVERTVDLKAFQEAADNQLNRGQK